MAKNKSNNNHKQEDNLNATEDLIYIILYNGGVPVCSVHTVFNILWFHVIYVTTHHVMSSLYKLVMCKCAG